MPFARTIYPPGTTVADLRKTAPETTGLAGIWHKDMDYEHLRPLDDYLTDWHERILHDYRAKERA